MKKSLMALMCSSVLLLGACGDEKRDKYIVDLTPVTETNDMMVRMACSIIGVSLSEQVMQAIGNGEDTGKVMKGFMSNNKTEPKGATVLVGENSIFWETAGIESKISENKIIPFVMPEAPAFFFEHEKQLYIQMHTKRKDSCNFRLNKIS